MTHDQTLFVDLLPAARKASRIVCSNHQYDAYTKYIEDRYKQGCAEGTWTTRSEFERILAIDRSMANRLKNSRHGTCKPPARQALETMVSRLGGNGRDALRTLPKRPYVIASMVRQLKSLGEVFLYNPLAPFDFLFIDRLVGVLGDLDENIAFSPKDFAVWLEESRQFIDNRTDDCLKVAAAWLLLRKHLPSFDESLVSLAGEKELKDFVGDKFVLQTIQFVLQSAMASLTKSKKYSSCDSGTLTDRLIETTRRRLVLLEVKRNSTILAILNEYFELEIRDLLANDLGQIIMMSPRMRRVAIDLLRQEQEGATA